MYRKNVPIGYFVLLIVTLIGMLSVVGCDSAITCNKDEDCKAGDQVCTKGLCAAKDSKGCTYEGKQYDENASFASSDGCNTCSCGQGKVQCTANVCPSTCEHGGKTYQEGDKFTDDCNGCVCQGGRAICTTKGCPPKPKTCKGTCTESGDYCHFALEDACGEESAEGVCKEKPKTCDDIDKPVCGCDDKTYSNACLAHQAGTSVQKEGACATAPNTCGGSLVCANLQTQYCHFEPKDACGETSSVGSCKEKPKTCDDIDKPVCGCDDKTYSNACLAHQAGTSVQREGSCGAVPNTCGGSLVCADLQKQYCFFGPNDACGDTSGTGVCKERPTTCTDEDKPVCGCDGKTYGNVCKAALAGRAVRSEGSCSPAPGQCGGKVRCSDSSEYCHFEEKELCGGQTGKGVCKKKPTTCPPDSNPVCGCDGNTYTNACKAYAAGSSVAGTGACCATAPKSCGGYFNIKCKGTDEYCHLEPKDLCGAADAPGVCKKTPGTCPTTKAPVCGCDSNQYNNACEANAAGVSVSFKGDCTLSPGHCIYKETAYADGDKFQYLCNSCTCTSGQVSCTKQSCPPQSCGVTGAPPCPGGMYCDQPKLCGTTNVPGACKERRKDPCLGVDAKAVCGCDGRTYRSACEAEIAGVSVKLDSACKCI